MYYVDMRGFHFIGMNIQSTNFDTLIGYFFPEATNLEQSITHY